jgi:murein tripeptide amidase MpaA
LSAPFHSFVLVIIKRIVMHHMYHILVGALATLGSASAHNWPSASSAEKVDYTGHQLVKIFGLTAEQALRLNEAGLDSWGHGKGDDGGSIYRLAPGQAELVGSILRSRRAPLMEVINGNVQDLIDAEQMALYQKTDDWFGSFHPFEEIYGWYKRLAAENTELVRFVDGIGQTIEKRPIFALHIGKGGSGGEDPSDGPRRPNKIWLQCLIHAREWISGSTCQYIANELVTSYATDPEVKNLLDTTEIIMVPVVNPDGYAHSWARDRLWRKNRRWFRFGTGVDLNRNFDDHWCQTGASHSPFTDIYCGPERASEAETQAVQRYYGRFKGDFAVAIDFHSFSQLILRPNGYTKEDCPDEKDLVAASALLADAIRNTSGLEYTAKKSSQLYPTAGSATDYFYALPGQAFRPYSITIELRPGDSAGFNGFILKPDQIVPVGQEVMAGLLAFTRYALSKPLAARAAPALDLLVEAEAIVIDRTGPEVPVDHMEEEFA